VNPKPHKTFSEKACGAGFNLLRILDFCRSKCEPLLLLPLVLLSFSIVSGQARRVPSSSAKPAPLPEASGATPTMVDGKTPSEMYEDARTYSKRKFDELRAKKQSYDAAERERIKLEAKQTAAKYAAALQNKNLNGEDFFYLGSLHALAENADGAETAFKKYLSTKNSDDKKAQTARAFLIVANARTRDFAEAEAILRDFLKNAPVVLLERLSAENELARAYLRVKDYERAAAHADAALLAARPAMKDIFVDAKLSALFGETSEILFDAYEETKQNEKALQTLEILREAGIATQSADLYLDAIDRLIPFLIETARKPQGLERARIEQAAVNSNFREPTAKTTVAAYFKERDKQFKLLGEAAPELVIDKWIADNNAPKSLAAMRGRVVLLDFWATWCVPCFAAFPKLSEWQESFADDGLKIVGVTRYYGVAKGMSADDAGEFQFLQQFRRQNRIAYPLAVAKNAENHNRYAVAGLPTTVLIDKKGIVRRIETGFANKDELEKMIRKLLAE
jgi:thiol-disulfide isomerase/thioredoxin